ncbi:hypothetical protein BDN71DRAFT_1085911 [Pleurotus eryngii]|uniref:Uncharacterized protein n=1 Tax=Pleurotus eryngii TaxID=5323 RepID=A0A9P5ZUC4_PLEER|nr:hypothetical protein BDN71DRAFT_1085911 [Pleurotus eryngii]
MVDNDEEETSRRLTEEYRLVDAPLMNCTLAAPRGGDYVYAAPTGEPIPDVTFASVVYTSRPLPRQERSNPSCKIDFINTRWWRIPTIQCLFPVRRIRNPARIVLSKSHPRALGMVAASDLCSSRRAYHQREARTVLLVGDQQALLFETWRPLRMADEIRG